MFKLLFLSVAFAGAIFGTDDRIPVIPSAPWAPLAGATGVAVLKANVNELPNNQFDLDVDSVRDSLCPSEKFRDEPSLQYACSGFLITPTLLVTAGHCSVNTGEAKNEPKMYCEAFYWYFDYKKETNGLTKVKGIAKDKLYNCKQIIYAVRDEQAPFQDFALIELDRQVVGHTPLKLSSSALNSSDTLKMIGYPMGMPAQIALNGKIFKNDLTRTSFITNLDAFDGNSGSAVLNSKDEVVGILIGGTPSNSFLDFNFPNSPGKTCVKLNTCSVAGTNCREPDKISFPNFQAVGAEVQRIAPILELIKNLK